MAQFLTVLVVYGPDRSVVIVSVCVQSRYLKSPSDGPLDNRNDIMSGDRFKTGYRHRSIIDPKAKIEIKQKQSINYVSIAI